MKIHLTDGELKDAITSHLSGQENIDLNPDVYDVEIQLTAGRGDKGHYADITRTKRTEVPADDPFDSGKASEKVEPDEDDPGVIFD